MLRKDLLKILKEHYSNNSLKDKISDYACTGAYGFESNNLPILLFN